jgi:hypothetical protein
MTHEEKEFIWNSIEILYNAQQKYPLKFTKEFIIISKDNYLQVYFNNRGLDTIKIEKNWRITHSDVVYQVTSIKPVLSTSDKIDIFLSFIKPFMREIKLDSIGI